MSTSTGRVTVLRVALWPMHWEQAPPLHAGTWRELVKRSEWQGGWPTKTSRGSFLALGNCCSIPA
jgi:hypothetical protein